MNREFGCPQWCRYIHVTGFCRTECLHTDGIVVNITCVATVCVFINFEIELCFIYFISLQISRSQCIHRTDRQTDRQKTVVCHAAVCNWMTWWHFWAGLKFKHFLVIGLSWDRWVIVVNGLWTGQLKNCGVMSSKALVSCGSKCPSQLLDPPSCLFAGYWAPFSLLVQQLWRKAHH
jgi:hypothetical protein